MALSERFTLRNLYLYLVCLITLVVALFAAVQFVRSTVSLLYPDPGYYGWYAPTDDAGGLTEEEQQRQEQLASDSQRRQSVLDMVSAGTTLLITAPLYVYHWRRIQSELPARAGQGAPAEPVAG